MFVPMNDDELMLAIQALDNYEARIRVLLESTHVEASRQNLIDTVTKVTALREKCVKIFAAS